MLLSLPSSCRSALAAPAIALAMLTSATAGPADVFYSRGVQAYYEGRYDRAESYFDRAVHYAPSEPRAYYFRGLARFELGRPEQAESDLRNGAVVEAGKGRAYRLGDALASTSGESRDLLDAVRTEMLSDLPAYADGEGLPGGSRRAAAALRSKFRPTIQTMTSVEQPEQLAALYEEMRPSVLKRPKRVIAKPTPPPAEVDWLVPADARGSMTASELIVVTGDVVGSIVGPAKGVANQVHGAIPGGPSPGGGEPFAGESGDPFGGDNGESAGDPFGDDPDPFGAAPAGGDPFGASPAREDNVDPFADDQPNAGGAESDPFGGGDDGAAGDDPFGGDPFGGDDPFN